MMTLATRQRQMELMDGTDLDQAVHQHALRGLRRLNAISFSSHIVWPVLRDLAATTPRHTLRVLDLACGGGDVVCRLARWAERLQVRMDFQGWDRSRVAVDMARDNAVRAGVAARFLVKDISHDQLPTDFDVVMCSLFLHHLPEQHAIELLRSMRLAARRAVLVNDLRRTRLGYALAWTGCRLLTRSPIVHVDGPRSVAGAFTEAEVKSLAAAAGWGTMKLTRHWPQRFLLRWDRT